mmetsp:Transcript_20116/g.28288  ORF Transcript_20116/g.28288 Transcript_20116/m.28288 type:complete len:348 (+) Transcript_20116:21-1064(+)
MFFFFSLVMMGAFAQYDDVLEANFKVWVQKHKKQYQGTPEFERRLLIFKDNAEIVRNHNEAFANNQTTWTMGLEGPFADLSASEFESLHLQTPQNCSATHHSSAVSAVQPEALKDLPTSVDWRTKGVVTPVKNQGQCGSCWTFSTTGCLEAHWCLHKNRDCSQWTGLAEQQLVDCAQAFNNFGCDGGLPSQAFEYVRYNDGLDTEESYPYTAKDGSCKFDKKNVGATVKDVHNITAYDENGIVEAVANTGPVSIAFQVASDFRLYTHGVYDSYNATTKQPVCKSGPSDVNHAVLVVGYGVTGDSPSVPFHIIKNSWGTSWGMEGYFWMVRGKNMCGISDCASYPIVA